MSSPSPNSLPPFRVRRAGLFLLVLVTAILGQEFLGKKRASRWPASSVQVPALVDERQVSVSAELSPLSVFATLKIEDVAASLGYSVTDLQHLLSEISVAYADGNPQPTFCVQRPLQLSVEALCEAVATLQPPSSRRKVARVREVRLKVSPANFRKLQSAPYRLALSSLKSTSPDQLLKEVPQIVKEEPCPHNFSAAALRHLEDLLPAEGVLAGMEKLYKHASECLQPTDEAYEVTHFRQALLREMNHDREGARESIRKAALTVDPKDPPRLDYWAGWFEDPGVVRTDHWNKILRDRPLSFQALLVWEQLGIDPHRIFAQRTALAPLGTVSDPKIGAAIHWMEAFVLSEKIPESQWLVKWIYEKSAPQLVSSNILYLGLLLSKNAPYLDVIAFLNRAAHDNTDFLNTQVLSMLYPKPFFEIFDRATPNMDTYLMLGLARQESGFNPQARSRANARGLLQILPATAELIERRSSKKLFDVETNTSLGVRYVHQLIERFGTVELALAAYNAGPERVDEWQKRYPTKDLMVFLDLIPYRETRNYVPSILRNNYWYRRLYSEGAPHVRSPAGVFEESEIVKKIIGSHMSAQN